MSPQRDETFAAKLRRVVGGKVCSLRGGHRLVLADQHWSERSGVSHEGQCHGGGVILREMVERTARRPMCSTCWQFPGD